MAAELREVYEPATPPEPEQLLSECTPFEDALEAGATIAVTGGQYAGRSSVLEYAADALETTQTRLDPGESTGGLAVEADPLVVDNCQHLYTRAVDGFDRLQETLTAIANSDGTVVTGWNDLAWSYLDRIEAIDKVFDEHVSIQALSADELEAYLRERREIPTIEEDTLGDSIVSSETYTTGWREVTLPKIDFGVLNDQLWPTQNPAQAFFARLCSLSRGNPGVALALFDQLTGGPVSPSDLTTPSIDVEETGVFLLRLLLGNERAAPELLADRVGGQFDRLVGRLTRAGITTRGGDSLMLTPTGVPTALDQVERRRII